MINRNESISNSNCTVVYNYWQQGVIVQSPDFMQQRIFGGYPALLERYRELADNFSEQITFQDACDYFTLSTQEYETYHS